MTSASDDGWGPRPTLIAHRVGNAPDQIATAVAAGAHLVEADVHLYRGRIEIRHTKTMGVLPWLWDRWYVVPASDPRPELAALVAGLPDGATLMLDLKGWHPWLGHVVAVAMETAAPGVPYVVAGRRWGVLGAFEDRRHVRIIHSAANTREVSALSRRLSSHRTDAICVKLPLLAKPGLGARLHELAPVVLTWPIGDTATAQQALGYGADGLIVDGVDLLADLARGRYV